MGNEYKRRFGDRKDARLIRGDELDTNHFVMGIVWPSRTVNEGFINERIDLTAVDEYLKKKNEGKDPSTYSLFMFMLAVLGKTFINRPKMNRFYRHNRLYERYKVSIGFIVKKAMNDNGDEAMARVYVDPNDNFETFCDKVRKEVEFCRSSAMDKSSDDLRILMKFPFFIGKAFLRILNWIGKRRMLPDWATESDLWYNSIVVSHLGSIRLHASYHHLSDWGTNSFFATLGERKIRPFYDRNGKMELKNSIDIGMTIDERIADGYYYGMTIRLMKRYFAHPELLDGVFKDEVKEIEKEGE